jgi:hypothetical protein
MVVHISLSSYLISTRGDTLDGCMRSISMRPLHNIKMNTAALSFSLSGCIISASDSYEKVALLVLLVYPLALTGGLYLYE